MATLVLEGAPVDPARASRRLAYELEGTHVAAIAWSDASGAPAGALAQAAQALADAVGAARPLAVSSSSAATWVWAAARHDPDPAALEAALAGTPGVRLALGERGPGVEGFRRSHRQALVAQRLVARLGSAARVVRHRDVEVVALVTHDEDAADALVAGALGELAGAAASLRETLRTYLRHGWNATRTAEALFAHRNTVVGRIARAEALLPRPLRESALEVAVALEVLRWRGEG
nr:helix-turn-helix domain-containing protein [Patulibacter sp. SYSU D01012]